MLRRGNHHWFPTNKRIRTDGDVDAADNDPLGDHLLKLGFGLFLLTQVAFLTSVKSYFLMW